MPAARPVLGFWGHYGPPVCTQEDRCTQQPRQQWRPEGLLPDSGRGDCFWQAGAMREHGLHRQRFRVVPCCLLHTAHHAQRTRFLPTLQARGTPTLWQGMAASSQGVSFGVGALCACRSMQAGLSVADSWRRAAPHGACKNTYHGGAKIGVDAGAAFALETWHLSFPQGRLCCVIVLIQDGPCRNSQICARQISRRCRKHSAILLPSGDGLRLFPVEWHQCSHLFFAILARLSLLYVDTYAL